MRTESSKNQQQRASSGGKKSSRKIRGGDKDDAIKTAAATANDVKAFKEALEKVDTATKDDGSGTEKSLTADEKINLYDELLGTNIKGLVEAAKAELQKKLEAAEAAEAALQEKLDAKAPSGIQAVVVTGSNIGKNEPNETNCHFLLIKKNDDTVVAFKVKKESIDKSAFKFETLLSTVADDHKFTGGKRSKKVASSKRK